MSSFDWWLLTGCLVMTREGRWVRPEQVQARRNSEAARVGGHRSRCGVARSGGHGSSTERQQAAAMLV